MGDNVSETSSTWVKDELEYVDEVRPDRQQSSKESLVIQDGEEPVSAAVSLVVSSARHGVIALCANVAHILREKKKLQQRVIDLEKQMIALENSSSGSASVNGSCSVHCQATDLHSFHESPISQRCDSAPASFIASGLKFLKNDYQNNVECTLNDSSVLNDKDNRCVSDKGPGLVECRTSSISMPETHSSAVPKIDNNGVKETSVIHGLNRASTRSLNICQSLPASRFMRRKYSTISLRRVRRSAANCQKISSTCSASSVNSSISSVSVDEQHKGSDSSSFVVTVAEVHTPPSQQITVENSELGAVKLLARTLTNVLQGKGIDKESFSNGSSEDIVEVNVPQALKSLIHEEFSLPHPLAGCECAICLHLSADPDCHLYALTTEDGTLLPSGSRVLVEGDRVGTVVYLGHERCSAKNQNTLYSVSAETSQLHDNYLRPVGVTVKLWAPDHGELFVPLHEVICQLDDDLDLRKESWSNYEYEYLEEDIEEHQTLSSSIVSLGQCKAVLNTPSSQTIPLDISKKPIGNVEDTAEIEETKQIGGQDFKTAFEEYFIRSPSVSSNSSEISHSLGDLSVYGLECGDDDIEFNKEIMIRNNSVETHSSHSINSNRLGNETMAESIFNTTFITQMDDFGVPRKERCRNNSVSLYDTSDSAISLSFTRRLQHSEDNSEPSSLMDTGRESPHFGDTWDSGCSVGRGRCKSDSSGHFSDMEQENPRLGNTFAKSLGDALNRVLEKQKIKNKLISERNVCGDRTPVSIDLIQSFQRTQRDKEPLSYKYEINGNVQDQSEV